MEAIDVTPVEVPKSGQAPTAGQGNAAPKSKIGKIIIGFIIVAVIVVIIFIATGNKASAAPIPTAATGGGANLQPTGTGSKAAPKTSTTNTLAPKTTTPLVGCQQNWSYKEGNGGYIQDLQKFLNATNSAGLVTDGYYGAKTDAAVVAWTRKTGKTAADVACATWTWKSGGSGGSTTSTGGGILSDTELKSINAKLNMGGIAFTDAKKAEITNLLKGRNTIDAKTRYKAMFGKDLFTHMTEGAWSKFTITEATMILA